MITAHSGCEGTPMNSEEYIRLALSLDAEALEIDIRRSKGGELVLTHDADQTEEALKLADAFDMIALSDKKINCDAKEYGLEADILKAARKAGIGLDRIIFTGSVKQRVPGTDVFFNAEEIVDDFYARATAEDPGALGEELLSLMNEGDVLNINFRFLTDDFIAACGRKGVRLSVWTPNGEDARRYLVIPEVLNVTTRTPIEVLACKKEEKTI